MTAVFDVGAELEKSRGLAPKPPREEQEEPARPGSRGHGAARARRSARLGLGRGELRPDPLSRGLRPRLSDRELAPPRPARPRPRPPRRPALASRRGAAHVLGGGRAVVPEPGTALARRRASRRDPGRSLGCRAREGEHRRLRRGDARRVHGHPRGRASRRSGSGTRRRSGRTSSPRRRSYDCETIRRTVSVADTGLSAAVAAAAAGVPEYEMCLRSLESMASLGAEFLHGSGMSTHINVGSFSDAISNVRPFLFSARRLEEGQMFWLDLSASYAGCYTDTDRTISVGRADRGAARDLRRRRRDVQRHARGGPCRGSRRRPLGEGDEGRGRRRVRRPLQPRLSRTHHRHHHLVAPGRCARGDCGAPPRELRERRARDLRPRSGLGVHREHALRHRRRSRSR